MKYTVILENQTNDKSAVITLPTIPRIGEWINWSRCNIEDRDFAEEGLLTVVHLVISSIDHIKVVVDESVEY